MLFITEAGKVSIEKIESFIRTCKFAKIENKMQTGDYDPENDIPEQRQPEIDVQEVSNLIGIKASEKFITLKRAFSSFDGQNSGRIYFNEFMDMLGVLKIPMDKY